MSEYAAYTVQDFVDLIDASFEDLVGSTRRIDIEWGSWSRDMNLEIRKRLEDEDCKDRTDLILVFSYWLTVSQLLDLIYNCKGVKRFIYEKKIKRKSEEAIELKNRIKEHVSSQNN